MREGAAVFAFKVNPRATGRIYTSNGIFTVNKNGPIEIVIDPGSPNEERLRGSFTSRKSKKS